jgi:putative inorganic carbon (HCO3(-)) transporter
MSNILPSVKLNRIIVFAVLSILSVGIAFVIAKLGMIMGILLTLLIVGIPFLVLLLTDVKFGFFSILVLSYFISFIIRMTNGAVPVLVLEILMLIVFAGLIIRQIRQRSSSESSLPYLKHPITIALILWTIFAHIQLLNPASSSILGKLIAIRMAWYNLLGFVIALQVFDNLATVKFFFKAVLGLSMLAAFYGLSQKYIGLLPYDHAWLFSDPEHVQLAVIGGQVRTWAFMNDPANFGLVMAFVGTMCFIFMLGPYSTQRRIILCICGLLMFLAMVSSGTRTAFVMVIMAFGVFGLLTVNNIKTILFSISAFMIFLGIYFGPFYSPPVQRIRSAFQGNDDPSMNVRSINKARIQPYIWSHPIGGGPATTGDEGVKNAPGHPLAGFPPDSGYLKVGLELGFIGLLILLWQHFIASSKAIRYYFSANNREIKNMYVVLVCTFIAMCAANLTQLTSAMRPFDFFTFAYYAILIKLPEFDKKLTG